MKHRQPLRHLIPLAFTISIGSNILSVGYFYFLLTHLSVGYKQFEEAALKAPFLELLWTDLLANVLPFVLVVVAMVVYYRPLVRWLKKAAVEPLTPKDPLTARRLLNYPLVSGLWGIAGWLVAWAGVLVQRNIVLGFVPDFLDLRLGQATFIQFFSAGLTTFIFSYFLLEWINRRHFIPQAFPVGNLAATPGVIRLKVSTRFLLLAFAIGLYPLLVLGGVLGLLSPTEPLAANGLVFIATFVPQTILLTLLVAKLFQQPLVEMKEAAGRILEAQYDHRVSVTSADEMGALGEGLNLMAAGLKEREQIKDTFGKMVDPAIRDHLLGGHLALGGELKPAAILFSDLRDFTTLSESLPPEVVVGLLNRYFAEMNAVIADNGGLVNKFMGDAIMALFNVPLPQDQYALAALQTALEMQKALTELNRQFAAEGLPELRMGIGLHAGEVLAGNIGSPQRMEYTVIGDPVNAASRLESLTKDYKVPVLLSGQFLELLPARTGFIFEKLDDVAVKGKTKKIEVYSAGEA